ncbi:hypothetical protein ABZ897_51160 [Nonomuraea sp. NPDC046802]|uniref:hypothetical protein n=1 Tax=Nonomuraea sp. NPDC046802 TaxID=3154919 RepID=UPI003402B943
MDEAKLREAAVLVGSQVRVTVEFVIRSYRYPPEIVKGRLVAISRKLGPARNTRPYLLTVETATSVVSVSARSVTSVTSVESVEKVQQS